MRKTRALLKALTIKYPPGEWQRHSIRLNDDDLQITLLLGKYCQSLTIVDSGLDVSIEQMLIEVDELIPGWCKETERVPPGVAQQNKREGNG